MSRSPRIPRQPGRPSNSARRSSTTTLPRFLLHDRDSAFAAVSTTINGMGIQDVRTAPRAPWQNGYVERVIGSLRRDCLDHVIVLNETGLPRAPAVRRLLQSFPDASGPLQGHAGIAT